MRYEQEVKKLSELALIALNKQKNVTKKAGKDYINYYDIIDLMYDEILELREELKLLRVNKKNSFEDEFGDVCATLVLLWDWYQARVK
jgi:hypothetical protein